MSVTKDEVKRIAALARLAEPADRLDALTGELNGILDWVEQLNEVDVEGVEPMASAAPMRLPMRTDVISDGDKRDAILKNAPKADEGFFVVPKSVE